ncbi:MAG: L-threonylcarbamoyladenylate synthase [Arenimonas sp.]
MKLGPADADALDAALAALRRGDVVGLPTETVYGLAGDASDPDAVARIFALKGRPADHPLIVHVADAEAIDAWAKDVPELARRLAEEFWPGPLTLILRRQTHVLDAVTGGQDTVGLRCPKHPLALVLLKRFGGGLAAPSANRFGRISPTRADHVREEFGDAVPVVLDGGECEVGIESTIVDLSGTTPRILRPGRLGKAELEAVIGPVVEGVANDSPRVSGALASHYAPHTRTELLSRAALARHARAALDRGESVLALTLGTSIDDLPGRVLDADPDAYGHDLYAALRELDARRADRLLVESPPRSRAWFAVLDRLGRAAADAPEDVP